MIDQSIRSTSRNVKSIHVYVANQLVSFTGPIFKKINILQLHYIYIYWIILLDTPKHQKLHTSFLKVARAVFREFFSPRFPIPKNVTSPWPRIIAQRAVPSFRTPKSGGSSAVNNLRNLSRFVHRWKG